MITAAEIKLKLLYHRPLGFLPSGADAKTSVMSESPTSVHKERKLQEFGASVQEMDSDKAAEPSLCCAAVPDPADGIGH